MLNAVLALNDLDTSVFDSPEPGAAPRVYDNHITVPDAHLLFNGEFKRVGSGDLKIVGEDGQSFFIRHYFTAEKRAILMSPEGATLSAQVVEALAGPLAPGQLAQAGGQAASSQPVIGRVDALTGSATVVRNGVSVALNVGDTVRKGDVVQTSGGSAVAIVFADGTTFSLTANARMVLNDFVYNAGGAGNSASISLVQGAFSFVAGQVAKTGDMRVETPVATMGIRGTAVLVEISANDGQTRFSVMVEPDGTTGSFNLYNKTTGALIATVNNSQIGWVVTPAGPLEVVAVQQMKTPDQLQQELGIVQQIFTIFNNNQQNPFVPQDSPERRGDNPNDTNPQTAGGVGSGGALETTGSTFADLINNVGNNPSSVPTTVLVPIDPLQPSAPPVIVTVTPNQPPIAVPDPTGTPGNGSVIPNDKDPEGGTIRVISVQFVENDVPTGQPLPVPQNGEQTIEGKYGTLTIRSDGSYTYTSHGDDYDALPEDSTGTDQFQYTISDPFGLTASAVLTINLTGVNDAPVADADTGSVQAAGLIDGHPILGNAFAKGNVLTNDTDIDTGDILSVTGVSFGSSQATFVFGAYVVQGKYGFLTLKPDGTYVYTLNNLDPDTIALGEGATGTETFTYTIADQHGAPASATLTINVQGANSPPVILSANRTGSVTEDAQTNSVSNTLTKIDVDGDDTAANDTWSLDLRQGQAYVDSDTTKVMGQYGWLEIDQNGTWTYILDNTLAATNALDKNDRPVETFTVRVTDSHGAFDTQTVRVTVNGTNDAPVANNDTFLNVPLGWTLGPDNHFYKYVSAPQISWQQAAAAALAAGGYLATITSAGENDAVFSLVGNNIAWLGGSDAAQEGTWLWVTEPGGSVPFASYQPWSGGEPNNAGDLLWALLSGEWGEDYLVTWGNGLWNDLDNSYSDRQYVNGYVIERNGDPEALYVHIDEDNKFIFNQTHIAYILKNDTDVDGDTRTIESVAALSQHGAAVAFVNGQIEYDASESPYFQSLGVGQTATDTFTYTISDGNGGVATATVTVTVNGLNDAPTDVNFLRGSGIASADNILGTGLGGLKSLGSFQGVDPDQGASFTYSLGAGSSSSFSLSSNGQLSTGLFGASSGTYTLNVIATDEHGAASAPVPFTVWVGNSSSNTSPQNLTSLTNDTLAFGVNGNDIISTGSGNDVLVGGKGNDTLSGGAGADTLIGGAGADTCVFKPGDGYDTIADFKSTENDRIDLSAFAAINNFAEVSLSLIGANTVIDLGSGQKVVVQNAILHSYDFIFHS